MVKDREVLYHVTTTRSVDSIKQKGLIPMFGDRSDEFGELVPAVYMFKSMSDAEDALDGWLGRWFEDNYEEHINLSILEISIPNNTAIYRSLYKADNSFEVISYLPIPTEYIKVSKYVC